MGFYCEFGKVHFTPENLREDHMEKLLQKVSRKSGAAQRVHT